MLVCGKVAFVVLNTVVLTNVVVAVLLEKVIDDGGHDGGGGEGGGAEGGGGAEATAEVQPPGRAGGKSDHYPHRVEHHTCKVVPFDDDGDEEILPGPGNGGADCGANGGANGAGWCGNGVSPPMTGLADGEKELHTQVKAMRSELSAVMPVLEALREEMAAMRAEQVRVAKVMQQAG